MGAPIIQAEVEARIQALDARAEQVTHEVAERARKAADAEHAFKVAYAKAFLVAEGAMPLRKEQALVDCEDLHREYLTATALLDSAKEAGRNCRSQLEGQRSLAANLRPLVSER